MNPDKCFPSPLFLAIIIVVVVVVIVIIIIIILFVNYYSCAATTTTFTSIDNYLIACGSSQNITFAAQDKNLWKILNRVEQEISLTYLQTKHFLFCGAGGFFSFTFPKHFCIFSGKICCNETTAPRDISGGHGSSFDGESFVADESV
ncbi:Pkinase_Tyr domain-containing protein/Malectin_like domain-containing protein [Senna tora]|uniref:Pkinase_Tyr domain-containing protein/Malectin_like domain-containing protein n=1 Tax=Senna tora TaxID=362788 RepID=A0A834WUF0_9FABA|nr:Pkinase_Tyr domain-containing protein/Malectin_like domain-containing protein [Senna tora]